jgi:hypothetical protein
MGIDVSWDSTVPNLMRWDFSDPWTLDDFWKAYWLSHEMVADIDGMFDMILLGNRTNPPSFPLAEFQRAFRQASPKQNHVFIINESAFVRSILQVLQRLRVPKTDKIFFVRTEDEAYTLLQQKRQSQP